MLGRLRALAVFVVLGCVAPWWPACTDAARDQASPTVVSNAANPAARKCLEDGYQLQPIIGADGVPVDHECVDPVSGKRCEAWQYFRGECRLRDSRD